MKSRKLALMAGVVVMAGISTAALTEDKPDPSLKYRHHAMELINDAAGGLVAIMKGEADASEFSVHAQVLAASAKGANLAFSKKIPGGDAKTAVWDNWDDFSTKLSKFSADADALYIASSGDMKTKAAAFKQTMSNCKACHDDYRKEEK